MTNLTTLPTDAIPGRADIVIIGGGIVGLSAAWYLARWGHHVVVLEKGLNGAEQSSRNWGWVRMQGRSEAEVPLMLSSRRQWESIASVTGESTGLRRVGCTYLARTPEQLEQRLRFLAIADRFDLDTRMLSTREIRAMFGPDAPNMVGGIHTPSDCCAEPDAALQAIAGLAASEGAQLFEQTAVRTLQVSAGHVSGVVTEHGEIHCQAVLLAAGAWSRTFLENMGLRLPQLAVRSSAMRTAPLARQPHGAVGTSDVSIRPRHDGGLTIGRAGAAGFDIVPAAVAHLREFLPLWRHNNERKISLHLGRAFWGPLGRHRWQADAVSPFERCRVLNPNPDRGLLAQMHRSVCDTYPSLGHIQITRQWAGLIDVTPDELPVLGAIDQVPGLTVATGFSGHGFGLGPGAGLLAAEVLTGAAPHVDTTPFAYSRFGQVDGGVAGGRL